MKKIVIIGAGSQGRDIAELLSRIPDSKKDSEVIGFIDENPELKGKIIDNLPVLGDWTWFDGVDRSGVSVICGFGLSETRKQNAERAASLGLSFAKAISDTAYIAEDTVIGTGASIAHGAIINRGCVIGDHSLIGCSAVISHDAKLKKFATVNPGANIAGHVTLKEGAFIGIGVSIVQGISIGAWTTVGAGAAVIGDLPDNVVAVGVPAKVIKNK